MKITKTFELTEEEELIIGLALVGRIKYLENEIKNEKDEELIKRKERSIQKTKVLLKQF